MAESDITIPPDAWIAVANMLYDAGAFATIEECRNHAPAAIRAALKAWPGAQRLLANDLKGVVLRLPLPQEKQDD